MRRSDVESVLDVHQILDRLELAGNTQEYYYLNHTTPHERDMLLQKLTHATEKWLYGIGISISP